MDESFFFFFARVVPKCIRCMCPTQESRTLRDAKGQRFTMALLARRSSLHPGTRYLARGLNEHASPGNEVECELLVWREPRHDETGGTMYSSHVWRRGTVPIWWKQEIKNTVGEAEINVLEVRPPLYACLVPISAVLLASFLHLISHFYMHSILMWGLPYILDGCERFTIRQTTLKETMNLLLSIVSTFYVAHLASRKWCFLSTFRRCGSLISFGNSFCVTAFLVDHGSVCS